MTPVEDATLRATAEANEKGEGYKGDAGKLRWDLLALGPVIEEVRVLTFGAKKYLDWNWVKVPDARARYYAAAMRHLTAWWQGEEADPETGASHLAHARCCLGFLRALELGDTGPKEK